MAVVPFAQPWFSQWSPPTHIFNAYSHVPQQTYRSNQELSERFPQYESTYPETEPYAGQQPVLETNPYGPLIPGVHILNGPKGFPSHSQLQQRGVKSKFESVDNNKVITKYKISHPMSEGFMPPQIGPPKQSYRMANDNGFSTSMARFLPALMLAGLMSGNDNAVLRGDQSPDTPDPDRNLDGPSPLRTLYQWNLVDFEYESDHERRLAIESKEFIPLNTLPLGLEVYKDRVFVTFPRWKEGVPCTLATVPRSPAVNDIQTKLKPYPSWSWHRQQGDCTGLTSVFRLNADRCGRLWVLDSGQVEALAAARQVCPPQIMAFDLNSDSLIGRWPIPDDHVRQNSLFTNIISDIRDDDCDGVHIYFTDVWRYSILVFRLKDEKFWRFDSNYFYPDPLASDYNLHGINFQWNDGVFGISMTPLDMNGDRTLFFHPMSSYREFKMPVSLLRNESATTDAGLIVRSIELAGESRGYNGQSSASAIDRRGVMFYNLILRDAVGCWDTRKLYAKQNLGVVAQDTEKLFFPNDLKIDNEERQSVWVLSNKLPRFIYRTLSPDEINFRIMREYVDEAIDETVCDPKVLPKALSLTAECY